MKTEYAILIPTYKRADRLRDSSGQHTLAYLDSSLEDRTVLIVRESEKEDYLPVCEVYDVGIHTIPDNVDGIRGTRNECLKWAKNKNIEKLIMIDDDLRLSKKPDAKTYRTFVADLGHFQEMVDDLLDHCSSEYPVVGITARQFSNGKTEPYEENTRIIQVFCLHIPTILKEKVNFTMCPNLVFMTDYAFTLTMLQRGYKNLCLNTYCRDDNTQTPGGCAEYRDADSATKAAIALYRAFPKVVKPYVKTSGTWGAQRVNVRISWKKAYNED